jgi:hypothetical protein
MDRLSFFAMQADQQLKKKVSDLVKKKEELEEARSSDTLSPYQELEAEGALKKIQELIGQIRFHGFEEPEPEEAPKEDIQKGFDPDGDVYTMIDSAIQKGHLIGSEISLPLGTKSLADMAELELYGGLRDSVNTWFDGVSRESNIDSTVADLRMSILKWIQNERDIQRDSLQKLYDRGLEAGIRQTGVPVEKSVKKVDYMIYRDTGIGPAIDRLGNDTFKSLADIVRKHYDLEKGIPLYRTKRHIDSWLKDQRYQTRRILKTETAKCANWGMLKAWMEDPDRYHFMYKWEAITDERTKRISKMRYDNNPYSADEINFLFNHQVQKIGNEWENDTFNQRCFFSRSPISYEFKSFRFYGSEFNYQRTFPE